MNQHPNHYLAPLTLIAIGLVFLAMTSTGAMPLVNVQLVFHKFWPLLLILWGVFIALEHYDRGTDANCCGRSGRR